MMRSMFAGISGLRSHQTMMDVVGNNISNVNTAGFKSSVVTFQEALSQTIQGPTAAGADTGGANPIQIGLGVKVGSIDAVFSSLTIDAVRQVIVRAGEVTAELRRRSLLKRLLFLFASQPGMVFSKEEIVERNSEQVTLSCRELV